MKKQLTAEQKLRKVIREEIKQLKESKEADFADYWHTDKDAVRAATDFAARVRAHGARKERFDITQYRNLDRRDQGAYIEKLLKSKFDTIALEGFDKNKLVFIETNDDVKILMTVRKYIETEFNLTAQIKRQYEDYAYVLFVN